jgi:hypothetical protein
MRDITIKNIPDEVSDVEVLDFVAALIERYHDAKLSAIPEVVAAIKSVRAGIDSFRTANALAPKFAKVEPKEEELLPKDVPQG